MIAINPKSRWYTFIEVFNLMDEDSRRRLQLIYLAEQQGAAKIIEETGYSTPKGNYYRVVKYMAPEEI